MRPYADSERLNWRDDLPWNERGDRMVAEILSRSLERVLTAEAPGLEPRSVFR